MKTSELKKRLDAFPITEEQKSQALAYFEATKKVDRERNKYAMRAPFVMWK